MAVARSSEGRSTAPEIPVVDLARLHPKERGRPDAAAAIDRALRDIGSFHLVNHGVSQETVDAAFRASRGFFSLPLEEKMKIHVGLSPPYRGYVRTFERKQGTAALIGLSRSEGDFKEGLDFGPDLPPDDSGVRPGNPFFGPNVWPAGLVGFRPVIEAYAEACKDLARRLFELIAMGLALEPTHFADKFDRALTRLKLLHYPEPDASVDRPSVGAGAHTDYGCLTIVAHDDVAGLEVLGQDGKWISVSPMDGAFFINLGDQMAVWTNDLYRAPPHRVINASGRDRHSIAYFVHPNFDATIDCPPPCLAATGPRKYPAVRAGDDLLARLADRASYDAHPAAGEVAGDEQIA